VNAQELGDFSEEQQTELLRANEGLMKNTNITTQKDSRGSSRKKHRLLRFKGMYNFERGHFLRIQLLFCLVVYIYI